MEGELEFYCDICNKGFARIVDLKRHVNEPKRGCGCDEINGYYKGYDNQKHYFTCHFYKESSDDVVPITDPTEFMKITTTGLVDYYTENAPDSLKTDKDFTCQACNRKYPPQAHPEECQMFKIHEHNKKVRSLFERNGPLYGCTIKEYESKDL